MLFLFLCIYISPLRLAPLPSPLADSARLAWVLLAAACFLWRSGCLTQKFLVSWSWATRNVISDSCSSSGRDGMMAASSSVSCLAAATTSAGNFLFVDLLTPPPWNCWKVRQSGDFPRIIIFFWPSHPPPPPKFLESPFLNGILSPEFL